MSNEPDTDPISNTWRKKLKKVIKVLLCLLLIAAGVVMIRLYFVQNNSREPVPPAIEGLPPSRPPESGPEMKPVTPPAWPGSDYYPTDKLFVTEERRQYRDGDMVLEIPRLDFSGPVLSGVDDLTLRGGVGLFDYAQPPGYGNTDTSIAGHRDLYGYEFYYIDTITEGDLLYLYYKDYRYVYRYLETAILGEEDWSLIYCRDFPCLTLMSCTPVGIASHRIFVTAELIEIQQRSPEQENGASSVGG